MKTISWTKKFFITQFSNAIGGFLAPGERNNSKIAEIRDVYMLKPFY